MHDGQRAALASGNSSGAPGAVGSMVALATSRVATSAGHLLLAPTAAPGSGSLGPHAMGIGAQRSISSLTIGAKLQLSSGENMGSPTGPAAAADRPGSRRSAAREGGHSASSSGAVQGSSFGSLGYMGRGGEVRRSQSGIADSPSHASTSSMAVNIPDFARAAMESRPDSRRSSRPGSRGRSDSMGGGLTGTTPPPPAIEPLACLPGGAATADALSMSCRLAGLTFGSQLGRFSVSTPRASLSSIDTDDGVVPPTHGLSGRLNTPGGSKGYGAGGAPAGSGSVGGAPSGGAPGQSSLSRRSLGSTWSRDDAEPGTPTQLVGSHSPSPSTHASPGGIMLTPRRSHMSTLHRASGVSSDDDSPSEQPHGTYPLQHSRSSEDGVLGAGATTGQGQSQVLGKPMPRGLQQLARPYRLPPLHL